MTKAFNFFGTDMVLKNAFRLETDKGLNRMVSSRAHATCTFTVPHLKLILADITRQWTNEGYFQHSVSSCKFVSSALGFTWPL